METLLQDLRYGVRILSRTPGFTAIVVLILTLGIGANTAIFSVVNGVVLRPLPYPAPSQLLMVWGAFPTTGINKLGLSQLEFVRLRSESKTLKHVAVYRNGIVTLTGRGEPERILTAYVSANLFATLGADVIRGRSFSAKEEEQGHNNVVVLSHGFWQRRFAADPHAIGESLTLDGTSFTVIGVLPPNFQSPAELLSGVRRDLWLAPGLNMAQLNVGSHNLNTIARLNTGTTMARAQAEVSGIIGHIVKEHPSFYPADGSYHNFLTDLHEEVVGNVRLALLVLLGAVAFVLLIACANVASLMLARGGGRHKEMAIRAALGASRWRVVQQLLVESLLLALIGGLVGVLMSSWGLGALTTLSPGNIPRLADVKLDVSVLGFTLLISLLTGVLFGLIPALQASKTDLHASLKEGVHGATGGASRSRLRSGLVVGEMALALLMLVGAGLLIKSFWRLRHVDPGFNPENLLMMALSPPAYAYQTDEQISTLYDRLVEKIQVLPGVQSVAASAPLAFTGDSNDTIMQIEGRPFDPNATNLSTNYSFVTPAWFQTMGVRLVRGRLLGDGDREGASPVVVINERLAHTHWPHDDPLGKRVRLLDAPPDRATTRYMTIVGVVADLRNQGLNAEPRQEMFVPLRQQASGGSVRSMALVIRTATVPITLSNTVRQTVWSLDRNIPISRPRTMEELMAAGVAQQRFNAMLLGIFAIVALGLSAAGIYSVVSYSVSQRTHEIGIRMALGACTGDVLNLIVGQGISLTLIGIGIGLIASFTLTRLMKNLLFGVSATDPVTFACIAVFLALVAVVACYIPARRATKVDPMVALRYE